MKYQKDSHEIVPGVPKGVAMRLFLEYQEVSYEIVLEVPKGFV